MKKVLATIILLGIIVSITIFVVFYISFNLLSPNNLINTSFRSQVIKNISIRTLFKLHQVGDGRSDYATDFNFKKLEIEIINEEGEGLTENTKTGFLEEIRKVVKKPGGITTRERVVNIDTSKGIDDKGIHDLILGYPVFLKDSAKLQIFVLEKYLPMPSFAGVVKDAYNIFIFFKPIRELSYYEKSTEKAEISTILHEFAHLLGANHVPDENCILSEKVQNTALGRPREIVTSFCPQDLKEINRSISF